jgi:hypothetical protein
VEQASKYQSVINVKAAQAIGLTISETLPIRARRAILLRLLRTAHGKLGTVR